MRGSIGRIAGAAFLLLAFGAGARAQESASTQIGTATLSVGGGTAILTLPEIPSFISQAATTAPSSNQLGTFSFSDDFDDQVGGAVTASLEVPVSGHAGRGISVSLNGFWSQIESDSSDTCLDSNFSNLCVYTPLVDDPNTPQHSLTAAIGETITSVTNRDVTHWGGSLEARRIYGTGVSGVTRAPQRRTLALGADVRGIHQDLDVRIVNVRPGFTDATYDEDLDTTYVGVYAAWGRDYSLPFFGNAAKRLGLNSSFLLRGGVYHADTDYDGSLVDGADPQQQATSALSLSREEVAFIGGLVLETTKRIGRRTSLLLKSEYEYYSYVPAMAYNQVDQSNTGTVAIGGQRGTVIEDDDAFSARTTLRLVIGFGPQNLYR